MIDCATQFDMPLNVWINVDRHLCELNGDHWQEEDTDQWIFDEHGLMHIEGYRYSYDDDRKITAFLLKWS